MTGECVSRRIRAGHETHFRGAAPLSVFLLMLLPSLVLIIPLAYAEPPDQAWIAGIYDAGDYDAVVGLVTEGIGDSTRKQPAEVTGGPGIRGVLPVPTQVFSQLLCAAVTRGPPRIQCGSSLRTATSSFAVRFARRSSFDFEAVLR